VISSAASAVGDAQALAAEEAKVGAQCDKRTAPPQPSSPGSPSAMVTRADGSSRGME
jgi:hypothetical protein